MDELAGLAGHTLMEHRLYVKRDVTARPFFLLILWLQRLDVASAGENMVVKAFGAEILKANMRLFHGPVDHSAGLAQFGIVAEIGPFMFSEAIFIVESFATILKYLVNYLVFFLNKPLHFCSYPSTGVHGSFGGIPAHIMHRAGQFVSCFCASEYGFSQARQYGLPKMKLLSRMPWKCLLFK
jgi:hypothetical protein